MVRLLLPAASALLFAASVLAADAVQCSENNLCPENLPCCSQYGQCGLGAYCLGGCDPRFSHTLDSCTPAPICKSSDFKMTSTDGMMENTQYLGDASKSNWVYSGAPAKYTDNSGDQVLLTMKKGTVGTLLASTSYLWYGKVSATMKTSRTQGVVTAFILLSDVKDEIDFEFVGTDLNTAQTNYYWQAVPDYTKSKNLTVQDTFNTYHTYEIDWKPDSMSWSIDGNVMRTVNRNDTWNATTNQWNYPQTPARIQLSLWPAGLSTNAPGTVAWAGGLVNWNAPDVQNAGYFYAMVNDVNIECYNPPSGALIQGNKSYIYNNNSGLNNTVVTTDKDTVLKSQLGSGTNMDAGAPTASASGAASTSEIPTVPGVSGAGSNPGGSNPGGVSPNSGSTSSSGSSSGSSSSSSSSTTGDFSGIQGLSAASSPRGEHVMQGSMLAVVITILALLAM